MGKRCLLAAFAAVLLFAPAAGQEPAEGAGSPPAIELPASTTAGSVENVDVPRFLEIIVSREGERWVRGKAVDLEKLREEAFKWAEWQRDLEHPSQPSEMAVLVSADGRVRWREIQWTLQACADPAVRLYRIYLATKRGEDGKARMLRTFLPRDRGIPKGERFRERPIITVELKRKKEEMHTRVKLLDSEIGVDEAGFALLDQRIGRIHAANDKVPGQIHGWAWVPYADVVRAIDSFRKAGIEEITFIGAPPPGQPRKQVVPGGPFGPPIEDEPECDSPVGRGLAWLAAHQSEEGYWDADGFTAACGEESCGGPGRALYDPGVSGLALLAFLENGQTHKRGLHRKVVRNALKYLKQIQDPEGCFGPRVSPTFVYNHAIATLAMVRAYALTASPLFKQSAQQAVDLILAARNPYLAWRYGNRPGDNDTSVTSWMICALKAAEDAGLRVDPAAYEGAMNWLDKATAPESGRVGYTSRGTALYRPEDRLDRFPAHRSEALTAAALYCRLRMGEKPERSKLISKGADLCLDCLPDWNEESGGIDLYYWHFGTAAFRQLGGQVLKSWKAALEPALLEHQRQDGHARGSWDPVGVWGPDGGRIYSTALCLLCLRACNR